MDERQVGTLRFQLDLSQPIYEQILQQMCGAIARGEIALGEKIPSVRDMAQSLKVTPNTVMHAYQEIERYGLTETRRGQGTFITNSQEKVNQFRQEFVHQIMEEFLEKMRNLGYSYADIERYLREKQGGSADS